MTRGGNGKPVPIDDLKAVARVYVADRGLLSRRGMVRELGLTSTSVLHVRLQQIRQRTRRHSTFEACRELLRHPERYVIDADPDSAERIARRAIFRRRGLTHRDIAELEGVSQQAISEHFRRHPL